MLSVERDTAWSTPKEHEIAARVRPRGGVHWWQVLTLDEEGPTRRIEVYLDHEEAEALEAAGLSQ